ncbi:MAG: hypothetical protein WA708_19210 [Acidobacteriaceae bacterium]
MSRRPIPSVVTDFGHVLTFLQERGIISETPTTVTLENARKIHRATLSLILWRFRLGKIPEHGRAFIEEIASDALQILPQVFAGYLKTPRLLIRGILENTLRHIYFADHPVEFARMNHEEKWYITVEGLLEYSRVLPDFEATEKKFNALHQAKSLYSELSASIHGRRVSDLEMRVALKKIKYDEQLATKHADLVVRCAEISNFMLTIYQRHRFASFSVEDRRIILQTMNNSARAIWKELDT